MRIVLFQPEIPPNTGNVARLCAATGTPLHLIEPLGFSLSDRHLKRAGLDYWPHVEVHVHPDLGHFLGQVAPPRLIFSSARGGVPLHRFPFAPEDAIVLGPETTGLPGEVLGLSEHLVRIPIVGKVRSLNLSTAAGILLYEALRQTGSLG